jgi:hypothetical protein
MVYVFPGQIDYPILIDALDFSISKQVDKSRFNATHRILPFDMPILTEPRDSSAAKSL